VGKQGNYCRDEVDKKKSKRDSYFLMVLLPLPVIGSRDFVAAGLNWSSTALLPLLLSRLGLGNGESFGQNRKWMPTIINTKRDKETATKGNRSAKHKAHSARKDKAGTH